MRTVDISGAKIGKRAFRVIRTSIWCFLLIRPDSLKAQTPCLITASGYWKSEGAVVGGCALHDDLVLVGAATAARATVCMFRNRADTLTWAGEKPVSLAPYTLPGAMQVWNGWLFMCADDPKTRKDGRLMMFDIRTATAATAPPVFTFVRDGDKNFSMARAVAVADRGDHLLVAIASEHCTTIEFFISNGKDPSAKDFNLTRWCQWDSRTAKRKKWSDGLWHQYRSLALTATDGIIRLHALGTDREGKTVLDSYRIEPKEDIFTLMVKESTRTIEVPNADEREQAFGICVGDGALPMALWARKSGKVIRAGVAGEAPK